MTRTKLLSCVAIAAGYACGTGETVQIASVHVKTQLIVAASGGQIEVAAADHARLAGTRVHIPANALERDTKITVGIHDGALDDDESDPSGPTVELGPDGTRFAAPVMITIPYEGAMDEDLVRVFVVESSGARRVVMPDEITYDAAARTVTFAVDHFTRFQSGRGHRACAHTMCPAGQCRRGRCLSPPDCARPDACGPAPGVPAEMCSDGTVGGFTGRCLPRMPNGCAWEIRSCPTPQPACTTHRDCGMGSCVNGACVPQPPPACGPMECGPPPAIPHQMCPDGTVAGPTPCHRLANGVCGYEIIQCPGAPMCMSDRDCANGAPCVNGQCGHSQPPQCDPMRPCPPDATCENGLCVPVPQSCMSDRDCANGAACVNGQCGHSQPPPQCDPMRPCPPNATCNNGMCVPVAPSCMSDRDCANGAACVNGQCGPAQPPPQCDAMRACPPNATCQNGMCVLVPVCMTSQDCANGEQCDGGQCVPAHRMCSTDGDCRMGEACNNGVCGPAGPPPPQCTAMECGPAPALPNYLCPDGMTVAGPTACYRHADGVCGYDIVTCPGGGNMCASDRDCANGTRCINGACG